MFKHNASNDRNDSTSNRKSIRIPDILKQSRQKIKQKSNIKYQKIYLNNNQYSESCDYGTDGKKPKKSTQTKAQIQQLKAIMETCSRCMSRMSQFTTKKPSHHNLNSVQDRNSIDRWTQTTQKPFLLDLIQQRVQQICMDNAKLTKILVQKDSQIAQRQQQIVQIQDKFTNILYSLGQDYSQIKIVNNDLHLLRNGIQTDSQVPSYLKAMLMDQN